jgi:hypothetical protein
MGNIVEGIKFCQKKWLDPLERIDGNRLPKMAFRYQPWVRRYVGRPKPRWRDQQHLML